MTRSSVAALLFLACISVFGPSLASGLFSDDLILLIRVRAAEWTFTDLSRSFDLRMSDITDGWTPEQLSDFRLYFFRPLFVAVLKSEYEIFGGWEAGYHLTNLLLHFLVSMLVWRWSRDFGFNAPKQFLAAAVFAVYAPNQYAVNWVSGRTELLAAALILSSVITFGDACRSGRWRSYAVSFIAFLFALTAKENGVLIPALLTAAAMLLYRGQAMAHNLRSRLLLTAPFWLVLPFYFLVRAEMLGGFPLPPEGHYYHSISSEQFPLFVVLKISHAVLATVYQLPAMITPALFEHAPRFAALLAVPALATLVALAVWAHRRGRWMLLVWAAVALAPTLAIGYNPIYFYLPSIAVVMFVVQLATEWRDSSRRGLRIAGSAILAFSLVFGAGFCFLRGMAHTANANEQRAIAKSILEEIQESRPVDIVYLIDLPAVYQYLVPEIRWLDRDLEQSRFVVLNLSSRFIRPIASEVAVLDAQTFELSASEGPYLVTGFETVIMGDALMAIKAGVVIEADGYTITVTETSAANDGVYDPPPIPELRRAFRLPNPEQLGIRRLRYRFEHDLADPAVVFVQFTPDGPRRFVFSADEAVSAGNPR